jgi:hypothetical protein
LLYDIEARKAAQANCLRSDFERHATIEQVADTLVQRAREAYINTVSSVGISEKDAVVNVSVVCPLRLFGMDLQAYESCDDYERSELSDRIERMIKRAICPKHHYEGEELEMYTTILMGDGVMPRIQIDLTVPIPEVTI